MATGHFIREWRQHRGLTQEQLAEMAGYSHGAIGQLERGQVRYTQVMLEALARVLQCSPGDLIMVNPANHSRTLVEMIEALPDDVRQSLMTMVKHLDKAP